MSQFTEYQIVDTGKYKPNKSLILKLTNKYNVVVDDEMLHWYLNHGFKFRDITIKYKLHYD